MTSIDLSLLDKRVTVQMVETKLGLRQLKFS